MKDIAAKATNTTTQKDDGAPERSPLDRCYGQIGISAVAAAVRYQGGAKNPAYAPAPTRRLGRMAGGAVLWGHAAERWTANIGSCGRTSLAVRPSVARDRHKPLALTDG
jgi:hypothetical protein